MRIVIDATPLLLRSAGVKTALYHWVRALREAAGQEAIRLYPMVGGLAALDHERSVAGKWATWAGLFMAVTNQRFGVRFPEWAARGADVFHATNQTRAAPRAVPVTATVHDLTCWKMPEAHAAANVKADREFAERVVRNAAGLIAVSENTRRDAMEILGIAPEKITTIYNGVAEAYFAAVAPPPRLKPYVLFAGTIEPRKNLNRLLDAWALLPRGLREEYDLLVAGAEGWECEETMARLRAGTPGVRWLGYLPEAHMPGLVRGAALVVYVSLYEGFGLPLAEAMACGVAAVTSNVSSLPEIAGEGAARVDPLSVNEIRDAIARLLEDPAERARLGAAGRSRAEANFRWSTAAEKSLDFFRRVTGS